MNQISRFFVCRSLFRRNPFTQRAVSSKPISSSSLISNNNPVSSSSSNLITVLISKFHHSFNLPPPQIFSTPGNHFRKFSGEAAAADGNFSDDYLENEMSKVHDAVLYAWDNIERRTLPPLDAAKVPAETFDAFREKFGLGNGDLPHHLQRFEEEIYMLEESVDKAVAYGKYADAGGELGYVFEDWYKAVGRFQGWSSESENESGTLPTAQDQIAMPVADAASEVVAGNRADITCQHTVYLCTSPLFLLAVSL
ncbi:hypothetical protein MKX03_031800 [Papaver bracteatum]|nr:hypothetical protein MKX03_031800 [Papaver bracteatum]